MHNVPDPYRLLGVSRDATAPQIKAAHRRLAKQYHPDAPGGDQKRFLAVQEAYQLLADPARRRQWDVRHAPGPVRADAGATRVARADGTRRPPTAGPRPRPAAARPAQRASGSTSGTGPADGGTGPTWSARNVPWWESRESARGQASGRGARDGARPSSGRRSPGAPAGSRNRAQTKGGSEPQADDVPRSDFDVYSRSSGAAWSSAARAYFRKGVDDLPRGRAGWANRPRPRRPAASPWGATEPERAAAGAAETTTPGDSGPGPGRSRGTAARPQAEERTGHSAGTPRTNADDRPGQGPASGARTAFNASRGGVSMGTTPTPRFTSQGPHANLARARQWAITGRGHWPPAFQRLVLAVAGWLPPALAIAYTAATATGCDRAAVSCPPNFELVQVGAVAALLAGLLVLPRAAYLAAAGSAGLGVTALLLVIVYGVIGVPQPLPEGAALLTVGLWLLGYVAGVIAARHDWPIVRPWLREGWVVGPDAGAPSLGVAHRAPRG